MFIRFLIATHLRHNTLQPFNYYRNYVECTHFGVTNLSLWQGYWNGAIKFIMRDCLRRNTIVRLSSRPIRFFIFLLHMYYELLILHRPITLLSPISYHKAWFIQSVTPVLRWSNESASLFYTVCFSSSLLPVQRTKREKNTNRCALFVYFWFIHVMFVLFRKHLFYESLTIFFVCVFCSNWFTWGQYLLSFQCAYRFLEYFLSFCKSHCLRL